MESKIAEIIEDIFARGYTNEPIDIGVEVDRILALIAADRAGLVEALADNDELLEIGRKAIEDELIKWRDERLSMFNRGNGLVVREKDGTDSNIIRFGPETALKIGLKAIAKAKIDSALKGEK